MAHHPDPTRVTRTGPADLAVDGGDMLCVRLLLILREKITGVPAGTIVHLIATDPAAPLDLAAWCHLTGHTYLGPVPGADQRPYTLRAEAGALATDTRS